MYGIVDFMHIFNSLFIYFIQEFEMTISATFKDRFEELAKQQLFFEYVDGENSIYTPEKLMNRIDWLNALSEIDKQVAEERKIKDAEIQELRRGNARLSLDLGFIDELIEDNCKGEITAMKINYG